MSERVQRRRRWLSGNTPLPAACEQPKAASGAAPVRGYAFDQMVIHPEPVVAQAGPPTTATASGDDGLYAGDQAAEGSGRPKDFNLREDANRGDRTVQRHTAPPEEPAHTTDIAIQNSANVHNVYDQKFDNADRDSQEACSGHEFHSTRMYGPRETEAWGHQAPSAYQSPSVRMACRFVSSSPCFKAVTMPHRVQRAAAGALPRTPAEDLIDEHTSLFNLREDQLGAALLEQLRSGEYSFIHQVLDALGSTDRDDVAYEMLLRASDDLLTHVAGSAEGRQLLDRLFDELTAGSVAPEEQEQADRIMRIKSQRISPEAFQQGMQTAKIFPYRLPGLTVLNDAPIMAERRGEGQIWVRQPVRVLGMDMFREETRTLPTEVFLSGIELPEQEIVGVKMYDLGGIVIYRPALFLIQLANETDTTVLAKIAEAAGIGLTLGTGALAGLGVRATMAARVLLWADRAAFALGTIAAIIREHRGWIIERFGNSGREFLRYVDMVHSAAAIYGFARVALSMGQLIAGLRSAHQNWRSAVQSAERELSQNEQSVVRQTSQQVDDILQKSDEISQARQPSSTGGTHPEGGAGAGGITTPTSAPEPVTPPSSSAPQAQAAEPSAAPTASGTTPTLRVNDLSRGAQLPDRGGLTLAGRALQKHGSRPHSAFPRARGSVEEINRAGQQIVDEILATGTRTTRHHARFGEVIEVKSPDGRGLRFDSTGRLIGFLEPGSP